MPAQPRTFLQTPCRGNRPSDKGRTDMKSVLAALLLTLLNTAFLYADPSENSRHVSPFHLHWENNLLTVRADDLPGEFLQIWYLEAWCRPGSADRDWQDTVIGHTTQLLQADPDGRRLKLRCTLKDGVTVDHTITAVADGIAFELQARNPTSRPSQAHWAQPCIRVDRFTGADQKSYLKKSFVFLDGQLCRMPTPDWATAARYVPGQVWRAPDVDPRDVNPRPLNRHVPSNGLIGCFSKDETWVLATAWEPWQELFQGVIVCLHSDFRLGGLQPGESRSIRGRLYLMPCPDGNIRPLLTAYQRDFPEHTRNK